MTVSNHKYLTEKSQNSGNKAKENTSTSKLQLKTKSLEHSIKIEFVFIYNRTITNLLA